MNRSGKSIRISKYEYLLCDYVYLTGVYQVQAILSDHRANFTVVVYSSIRPIGARYRHYKTDFSRRFWGLPKLLLPFWLIF
jgi:hypothetical protein